MSEIKAIEKLRESSHLDDERWTLSDGRVMWVTNGEPNDINAVNWGEQWRKEREIAERYMKLPVDADGVPIRVGDVVEFGENRNQGIVKALNEHMVIAIHVDDGYTNYAKYGLLWNADACRHVKPRTVEDVLADYARDLASDRTDSYEHRIERLGTKYADELRELLGSDAR